MAKSPPGPPEHVARDEEDEDGEDDQIKQVPNQEYPAYPPMPPPPPIGYEGGAWMPAGPWMNRMNIIGGACTPGAEWVPQW